MKRTWTTVGTEYTGDPQKIEAILSRLEWQKLPCELGMMPGENIKEFIREFKVPKVSHVAVSHEMAPFGLYGIRGHYKDGMAQVYVIDEGMQLTPIASDFFPDA